MSADMQRNPSVCRVGVGTLLANSNEFSFHTFAGGFIHVPTGEGTPTLTFYVADGDEDDATFNPAYDKDGVQISIAAQADRAYEINPSLFGAGRLKILADAISGGDSVLYKIVMKS